MYYRVYISTASEEDLTSRSSDLVRFKKLKDEIPPDCTRLLEYRNKWYVGSKSECSFTFRHLSSTSLGFGEPVDWYPEEADTIAATAELYDTLAEVLSAGKHIDLFDQWEGAGPESITTLPVALDSISRKAFRLFENHVFKIMKTRPGVVADGHACISAL